MNTSHIDTTKTKQTTIQADTFLTITTHVGANLGNFLTPTSLIRRDLGLVISVDLIEAYIRQAFPFVRNPYSVAAIVATFISKQTGEPQ